MQEKQIKIVLVGEERVGKSQLLLRYTQNEYCDQYFPTQGIQISKKVVETDQYQINLQLWSYPGKLELIELIGNQLQDTQGIFVCFDLSKEDQVKNTVENWLELSLKIPDSKICLQIVGCKCDQIVNEEFQTEIQEFCKNYNRKINYINVSAKENINVDECFQMIIKEIINRGLC